MKNTNKLENIEAFFDFLISLKANWLLKQN